MRFLARAWLLVVLVVTFIGRGWRAAAQSEFLSLDCGAAAPYIDKKGISWVPDDAYMSEGMTASINASTLTDPQFYSDLRDLRYFPDTTKTRFCYSLPTTVGRTYLIRASFFHGGYDGQPVVKFDVGLDVFSTTTTFSFSSQRLYYYGEFNFRAFKDSIQYCLFRLTPSGNPFISSLELRPLDNTMYASVADGSALRVQDRVNFGGSLVYRYPSDPYDRFWWIDSLANGLTAINATGVVDTGYAPEKPPPFAMNTALAVTAGEYVAYTVTPTFHTNSFVINVFLAELQPAFAQSRMMDILLDGQVVVPNVNIYASALNASFKPVEFSINSSAVNTNGQLNVTLVRSGSPTGPLPIWNAVEFLSVHGKLPGTLASDAAAIEGLKKAFGLESAWAGDPCVLVPYDWLTCSTDSSPRVTAVKLSNASLSGPIPDLRALTSLTILYLDNNKLTGPIPEWLASLPALQELHLQNNELTGSVPEGLRGRSGLRVEGNPGLCTNSTCSTDSKSKSNVGVIVGVVVGVVAGVGIWAAATAAMCSCWRRRRMANAGKRADAPPGSETVMEDKTASRGSRYTLAQIMAATNKNAKMLGKGGFGPVYYGKLASGQEVAVKVAAKGSNQGSKEFINEIELLTRVHHKNLVTLVGYCDEGDNLILLYEYMSKGTVQEHLYGVGDQKKRFFLDWKIRLEIALNAAQGLEYLHVGCHPRIFHRDVKSNNILLNDKLVAKVADFGLSKSGEPKDNVTHMSTMVKGTIGYLDPEYYMTNQLTDKSDVYGFGIFLLELMCARPPFIQQLPEDQRRIDQWVRPHLQRGTIKDVVDPALGDEYNLEAMWKVADLAMQSVEPKGKHRPNMSTIVQELRSALATENDSSSSFPSSGPESSAFRFDIPDSHTITSDARYGVKMPILSR